MTLARELGNELKTRAHVDAAAAKGIVERSCLDKVRHIDVWGTVAPRASGQGEGAPA